MISQAIREMSNIKLSAVVAMAIDVPTLADLWTVDSQWTQSVS